MKRLIVFLLIFQSFLVESFTQESPAIAMLEKTDKFEFYSHFWLNLHHCLYHEAMMRDVAEKAALDTTVWKRMNASEQAQFDEVVRYYRQHCIQKDLRSEREMKAFKRWCIQQEAEALSDIPEQFRELSSQLNSVAPLYKKYFWPMHSEANRSVLNSYLSGIRQSEQMIAEELSDWARSSWQSDPIRVDICYFGKASPYNLRHRPYTTIFPTHVVMNASGAEEEPYGHWLELLFHEASHHLISPREGFIAGTIADVCAQQQREVPRGLWHAYLFYLSGISTKGQLRIQGVEGYELYMVRKNVFGSYYPALEAHLSAYARGRMSLHDATAAILKML